MTQTKKIIFFGTTTISVSCLQALLKTNYEIVAVVSQPDKINGRQKKVTFNPVKTFCLANNLVLIQEININHAFDKLAILKPDLILTCAFGQFISDKILNLPLNGSLNLHASLLPKYRGGAPIHWAIINGETKTGISLMKMIKKMDAGEVYYIKKIPISVTDTFTLVHDKLKIVAADIISNQLEKYFDNLLIAKDQDESKVTFAPNISKENTIINFNNSAKQIYNLIRGLNSKPAAKLISKEIAYKVFLAEILVKKTSNILPGTIIDISKKGLEITTSTSNILITSLQLPNKKLIAFSELINGNLPFKINDRII